MPADEGSKKIELSMESLESSEFKEIVQIDHQKICISDTGYNQILVIRDHFKKLAEAVPCQTPQRKKRVIT